jgi:hypothetical protein
MVSLLTSMGAYKIVTGEDPEPQRLDFDHDDSYDDCQAKEADATSI